MQITVRVGDMLSESADLAVLAIIEDSPLPKAVAELLELDDFRGRAKQSLLIYPRGAVTPRRLLLIGLGKAGLLSAETVRQTAALAAQKAQDLKVTSFALSLPTDLAACRREWGLGRHRAIFQKSRFGFVMRYSRFSPTNC